MLQNNTFQPKICDLFHLKIHFPRKCHKHGPKETSRQSHVTNFSLKYLTFNRYKLTVKQSTFSSILPLGFFIEKEEQFLYFS